MMKNFLILLSFITILHAKSLPSFSEKIIDEDHVLTSTQKERLLQHLETINHLKILIYDDFNESVDVRQKAQQYAKKLAKAQGWDKKDIILISLPKVGRLTAYLGDDINTERTSYESNNILDRATMYEGGGLSDLFTMVYLLIVQPDGTSFSTTKTHFDKLEHATLEYVYLLENYDLPLTTKIKPKPKEQTDWTYLYIVLVLFLLFRLKNDRDRWIVSLFIGAILGIVSLGTGLGNPILVFLIFAIWSSFSKAKPKDLFQINKNPKKEWDRNEDNTWDDD